MSNEALILVKFYAKPCVRKGPASSFLECEDAYGRRVSLDTSAIEFDHLQRGEWYRFLGEWTGGTSGFIRLLMAPVHVDEYEEDIHGKMLSIRDKFLENIDGLVGYAIKHK